jgi:hypothetical protein
VLERGNELHLLEGLPRAWTKPGNETRLVQVPTSFGPIDMTLTVSKDGKSARLQVKPPCRESAAKVAVHLEHFGRPVKTVKVGERELPTEGTRVPLDGGVTINMEFQ